MSIGDKPRRQSFALGQEKVKERPRVHSIKEELTDKKNFKSEGEVGGVRKSLSLFRRRKSMQLEDGMGRPSEARYTILRLAVISLSVSFLVPGFFLGLSFSTESLCI